MDIDDRLAYLPLADPQVARLLPELSEEERSSKWHLLTPEMGDMTQGAGLIGIAKELKVLAWLGSLLTWARAERLLDWFDDLLDRARSRLGKFVPDVEGPHRYP